MVDMSYLETGKMLMANILVEIDLRKGLCGFLKIGAPEGLFVQELDYEGIPF